MSWAGERRSMSLQGRDILEMDEGVVGCVREGGVGAVFM